MLTNLIENRGKEFSNLLKIGDFLGRSLRENVELFYVEKNKVTYLTESGGVITGNFSFKPSLKLSNIKIEDSKVLEDKKAFDTMTNKKVSSLLSSLLESDYQEAEGTFDDILNVFETKLSYDRIKERLQDKVQRFGEQTNIIKSTQFQKVAELKDKVVSFLKENKDTISKIPEIKNAVKLASVISKSFNMPKVTLESLSESKVFEVKSQTNSSIYEHLCRQELIAKELLEAKDNFDTTWANNELISDLASMIFERKRSIVENKVAEVITMIPYFALATKKQLTTIIENSVALSDLKISSKDINSFVSDIFEMKKPVKQYVINILNEKYGINISNLSEVPTFSNLLKTESLIFSVLAKLAPKNSVVKQTLSEFAKCLPIKNGAEAIDVVDFLNEVFNKAGYKNTINETSLLQYLDFAQVADDLGKIGSILKMLKPIMQQSGGNGMDAALQGAGMGEEMPEEGMGEEMPEEGMEGEMPEDGMGAEGEEEVDPTDAEMAADEVMNGEAGAEAQEIEEELPEIPDGGIEEGQPEEEGMEGEEEEQPVEMENDDINSLLTRLEDLISGLEDEVAGGGMEEEMPEEGMEDEEMPEEGMEDEEMPEEEEGYEEEDEEEQ